MLTPIEIEKHSYKKGFRGYSTAEVDEFTNIVCENYEKLYKENIVLKDKINILTNAVKQYKSMEYLNDFSNDTSVFCCLLTSFGYFAEFLGIFEFVCIYSAMLVVFLIAFYYRIIKPLYYDMKGRKGN